MEAGLKQTGMNETVSFTIERKTGRVIVDAENPCVFCKDNNTCDKKGIKPCEIPCG